jgi:tRNA threonylcarbamoyladenosine biosynthesis protein TsaE
MKQLFNLETNSETETEELAAELGSILNAGDVIALYGPLGSGKTSFVRGLARGLECTNAVRSPTFSLINEYVGRIPLYHIDFYRLEGEAEIEDLGWTDYLNSGGILAIEWAEKIRNMLPGPRFEVYLSLIGPSTRRVEIVVVDSSGN